ncbi:hypothetical protein KSP40_PGU012672 [Platanthera guangdongensis]|uniref:Uncharacterized protein n=1 Tax=Platanthera guangdongensis TaxID=2320717 RepID=A0ABR2N103_9ASPA
MEETYKTLLELHDTQMREKGEDKLTPEEAYTTVLRHHSGYIPGMAPGPKPLERKHTNVQKLREEIRAEFDVEMNIRIKGRRLVTNFDSRIYEEELYPRSVHASPHEMRCDHSQAALHLRVCLGQLWRLEKLFSSRQSCSDVAAHTSLSASAAFRRPVRRRQAFTGLLDFGNFRMAASLFPKQKGLLTSSEILGRGSNVIFGRTWLFLSQPFSTIGLLPQFGVNAVKGAHTVDQRAMCSVVGIISRMLSAPSMTESLCQFCLKQIDLLLSVTTQRPFSSTFHRTAMSSCSFEAGRTKLISHNIGLSGRSNGHVQTISRTDICSTHKSYNFCRILSGFLHNQVAGDRNLSSHCAWSGVTGFYSNFAPCLTLWNKDLHLDSVATCSTGGAQNISFDAISQDEQLESNGVEQNSTLLQENLRFCNKHNIVLLCNVISSFCYFKALYVE